MNILRLSAENVKRLTAVEIDAEGKPVLVIAGANEAGKSSVIDTIAYALGGEKLCPSKPIRKGQTRAVAQVDLGEYVVTRTFTPAGSSLTVTNRDGVKQPSPQALLDGLVGALTFDPLAFADMDDTKQADTLRRLAKLDTSDLEAEHKRRYDERTLVNRDATQLQGALTKAPQYPDAPKVLVEAVAVGQQLEAAEALAVTAVNRAGDHAQAVSAVAAAKQRAERAGQAVERARQALADAELEQLDADAAVEGATQNEASARILATTAAKEVPDRAALRRQLAEVEATNVKVRANQTRDALAAQVKAKKAEAQKLTDRLNAIESEKAARLAAAQFPVEGLGLDDQGVTWQGLPFAQASTAVRLKVSVAIGAALNPTLKVLLVRNGNDLDANNLQLLAEFAATSGLQLWLERIAGGDGLPTILIEDGAVVEAVGA